MKNSKILRRITAIITLAVTAVTLCGCADGCKKSESKKDNTYVEKEIGDMLKAETPYKIVLPEDATSTEEYSAEQIAYYYEQVGGKQMQIVKGGNSEVT